MANKSRKGISALYAEIPPDLHQEFKDLAEKNGRDVTWELIIAMRRHLAYPPPPREPDPLPALPEPTTEQVSPKEKRPRGRPRKKPPA